MRQLAGVICCFDHVEGLDASCQATRGEGSDRQLGGVSGRVNH